MSLSSLRLVLCAALLLLCAVARAQPDRERAAELFRQGNEEFAQGRVHRAVTAYREAWALAKTFDIACNLGRAEAELGLSREAAAHLDFCLRNFPASSRPELREAETRFRELFQRVRSLIAVVVPRVEPSGASLSFDGEQVGVAPLSAPLFVLPGEHRLSASLAGYAPASRAVEMRAGETYALRLVLTPVPAPKAAPVAPEPSPAAPARGFSPRVPLVIAGVGLSLLGFGAATALSSSARDHADRAERLRSELGDDPRACSAPAPPACGQLREEVDVERSRRNLATWSYVASAALAAGALSVWLFWPGPERADGEAAGARRSGLALTTELGPAGGRLGLRASF